MIRQMLGQKLGEKLHNFLAFLGIQWEALC